MSIGEALRGMLALMLANPVPAKSIQLKVAIQNSQVDVKETKQPEKVSTLL